MSLMMSSMQRTPAIIPNPVNEINVIRRHPRRHPPSSSNRWVATLRPATTASEGIGDDDIIRPTATTHPNDVDETVRDPNDDDSDIASRNEQVAL